MCVAGEGPQGCDITAVTPRTRPEWEALISSVRRPLLERLLTDGDPLDRAGTRIWAAVEAVRKATGEPVHELTVEARQGDGVLFRPSVPGAELQVLTTSLQLTRGRERIVAVVVRPMSSETEAPVAEPLVSQPPDLASKYGFDFSAHHVGVAENGPEGRAALVMRFPLSFRETANLSRTLYFTHYALWIGKLRELGMQPVYDELTREYETGRWGMVTNRSETRILGAVRADDVIEGRMWIDRVFGPEGSTQDLHYEWRRLAPHGGHERIAWSKMRATWVEILDHGVVEARPLPAYFQRFVDQMTQIRSGHDLIDRLPESAGEIELGQVAHRVPPGPVNRALLRDEIFSTSLENANLVGNLYFANYTIWQGPTRDHFFQELAADYYRGTGEHGELRCQYTSVEHLREAMPFERIAVRMSLDAVYERGVELRFDYFRVGPDERREKLAVGRHVAGWFAPGDEGVWAPAPLPELFRNALVDAYLTST